MMLGAVFHRHPALTAIGAASTDSNRANVGRRCRNPVQSPIGGATGPSNRLAAVFCFRLFQTLVVQGLIPKIFDCGLSEQFRALVIIACDSARFEVFHQFSAAHGLKGLFIHGEKIAVACFHVIGCCASRVEIS